MDISSRMSRKYPFSIGRWGKQITPEEELGVECSVIGAAPRSWQLAQMYYWHLKMLIEKTNNYYWCQFSVIFTKYKLFMHQRYPAYNSLWSHTDRRLNSWTSINTFPVIQISIIPSYKVQSRAYISSQYVEVNNKSNRLFLLVVPVSHPGVCGDNEATTLLAPHRWTRVTWVIDYEYNGIGVQHMVTAHFADLKTKIRFYQIKYKYV